MKPAPFDYFEPRSIDETMDLLATHGENGKLLAGGQSFVPLMNLRLARPAVLIDINRVDELAGISEQDGSLVVGALTRQQRLLDNASIRTRWPLLAEGVGFIGHRTIRNRGTVGGSIAHADPAAELPALAIALGAEIVVRGPDGQRVVPAGEFFVDYLTTVVEPNELVTEIRFPKQPERTGVSFQEVSRRHGDFAIVAVAATVSLDEGGRCAGSKLALSGVAPTPHAVDLGDALAGQELDANRIADAAASVAASLDPLGDLHASADYRRSVAEALSRRALTAAAERARKGMQA